MSSSHTRTVRVADATGDGGDETSLSHGAMALGTSTNAVTETP